MNDGNLLLLAVLRTKAREQAACDALCDFVLDHIPQWPARLILNAHLRIRSAELTVSPCLSLPPKLFIDSVHDRGARHPHGTRSTCVITDAHLRWFADDFRTALRVFRS